MIALLVACVTAPAEPTGGGSRGETGVVLLSAPELRAEMTAKSDHARLYNFWATWCGPCVEELPRLAAFAKDHPEIEVVFVNTEFRNQRPKVQDFVAEHALTTFRVPMIDDGDPDLALPAIMGDWPDVVPVTVFVRADGTRGKWYTGAVLDRDLAAGLASVQ